MKIKTLLLCIAVSAQVAAQGQKAKVSVDYKTCTCQVEEQNTAPRYVPALDNMTEYKIFSKLIPWKIIGGEDAYKGLFYKNLNTNRNATGSQVWRVFTLTSRKPVLFNHPQDSIGINLTPCQTQFYDFDVNATALYPVSRYVRNYDFEAEFDETAQSYVDILCEMVSHKELIERVFYFQSEEDKKSIIYKINKKYKTDIVFDTDGEYIDYISEQNLPFNQIICEMFVKTDDKKRPINEIEKKRISDIFSSFVMKDALEAVKEMITPTIMLKSTSEYISFVIDNKMLRTKDNTAVEILTRINDFSLNTKKGVNNYDLLLDIKEICLPKSEITGTGIEIAYTGGAEFRNSSILIIESGATIFIPSKEISVEVTNLNLNNKFISGNIMFFDKKISKYLKSKGFKINKNNKNSKKIYFEKTIK